MNSEVVTFQGVGTAGPGPLSTNAFLENAIRNRLNSMVGSVESVRVRTIGAALNEIVEFTVGMHVVCGSNRNVIGRYILAALEREADGIPYPLVWRANIQAIGSSGNCSPAPDLVGQGSQFVPIHQGGQLATVNVQIPPDDTTVATGGSGFIESIKAGVASYDTLTLILLGLAAVLVVRKL